VVIDTSVYSARLDPRGRLGHKDHEADRWVAATAIRLGVPLVAHDAIFSGTKDLRLISKLS
jgi:predicted nucleic acid-binding protein